MVHNPAEHADGVWLNIAQAIDAARFPGEGAMLAKAQKILLETDGVPGEDLERCN